MSTGTGNSTLGFAPVSIFESCLPHEQSFSSS